MEKPIERVQRADYGIDAPYVIRNLSLAGLVCLVAAGLYAPLRGFVFSALCLFLTAIAMVWSSRVGKVHVRERVMDSIAWRGDETVLDVGCGRGLMLIAAARRLKEGRVIGIDLWQKQDLSGNDRQVPLENARLEGVSDRVEVQDGDARQLPFPDATFDVVVSSQVIHNISRPEERAQALREIARVLKPGGQVAILDFRNTREYARVLSETGMEEVQQSAWRFAYGLPSPSVTARKAKV